MPRNTKPPPPHAGNIGPNKRTLEIREMAERAIVEPRAMGKPMAKQVLEDAMLHFRGIMSQHQPGVAERNVQEYRFASLMVHRFASALAPYQSPTFRAVFFTPEVIDQANVSEQEARNKMRQIIAGIAPDLLDDEPEEEDEPELVMTNGGGVR